MKTLPLLGALVAVGLLSACETSAPELTPPELNTLEQKFSYGIGANIGRQFKEQDQVDIDVDLVIAAIQDAYGEKLRMTDEEMQQVAIEFQEKMIAEQQAEEQAAASENIEIEKEFLATNTNAEGVVTLESGLQYKELSAGEGAKPAGPNAQVRVHYEGRLLDGTVFDSSYERGSPAEFGLNQVISGWTEAVQLMSEGATWELYIPSALAYGPAGRPPSIGPSEMLIFKVELLSADTTAAEEAPAE